MRALLVLILQAKLKKSDCWITTWSVRVSKHWNQQAVRDFRAALRLLPMVTRASWLQRPLAPANRENLKGNFKSQRINISPLHWLTLLMSAEAFVQQSSSISPGSPSPLTSHPPLVISSHPWGCCPPVGGFHSCGCTGRWHKPFVPIWYKMCCNFVQHFLNTVPHPSCC